MAKVILPVNFIFISIPPVFKKLTNEKHSYPLSKSYYSQGYSAIHEKTDLCILNTLNRHQVQYTFVINRQAINFFKAQLPIAKKRG
jgi:hypothetical protein